MIEQPVAVPNVGVVEADVICLNHAKNHALLWECKSGRTASVNQARVYAAVRPEHVQLTGNVSFPDPQRATVEVVYCCLNDDANAIAAAIATEAPKLPLISLGEKAELRVGVIGDNDVYRRFMGGVTLPPLELVPGFLVANTHTTKADLSRPVLATLVSLLRRQVSRISGRFVFEESFNDWACIGTDLRRYLIDQIKTILLDLSKNEFKEFAHVEKVAHSPGEFFLVFTADILGRDASSRTRAFQKFARLAAGYTERTEKNQAFEPTKLLQQRWLPGMEPNS
jgi:hypothetical protein